MKHTVAPRRLRRHDGTSAKSFDHARHPLSIQPRAGMQDFKWSIVHTVAYSKKKKEKKKGIPSSH